jgi:hypothetical protein
MIHIIIIHFDHLPESRELSAVHLPLASKPGLDRKPVALMLIIKVIFLRQARARPYQTHFSTQHVDELGKFIKSGHAKQASSFDQPRIADKVQFGHRPIAFDQMFHMGFMNTGRSPEFHAAELEDRKWPAIPTYPSLLEKHVAWRNQLDPRINCCRQENYDRQDQNH